MAAHHPWDSPGKNTGVGCHFLLQCMKVKSESEVAQLCPTLIDPMNCSLPGSSTMGFSRKQYWSGVKCTFLPLANPTGISWIFLLLFFPSKNVRDVQRHQNWSLVRALSLGAFSSLSSVSRMRAFPRHVVWGTWPWDSKMSSSLYISLLRTWLSCSAEILIMIWEMFELKKKKKVQYWVLLTKIEIY